MQIGFDYYELRDRNKNICSMTVVFSIIMFLVGILMAVTCESIPSAEVEQQLLNKKCEYIKGYIDNRELIPTWQKEL